MPRPKSLAELQVERARLLERIAAQREVLGQQFAPVGGALQWGDRVLQSVHAGIQFLRGHPLAMGALTVALLLRRPRLSLRWARRGLFFWRSWRTGRKLLATVQEQLARAMAQVPDQPARYRRR